MTKQGGWPPSGFGRRLKVLRTSRGWSQAQLAEQAGCHRFTVAKLEQGLQEPAWPLVLALARALGVSCDQFIPEEVEVEEEEKEKAEEVPRGKGQKTGGAKSAEKKPAKKRKG